MTSVPAPILARLRCKSCGSGFGQDGGSQLTCANGHVLEFRHGYLDVSSEEVDPVSKRIFDSFGFEWNAFDRIQPEDLEFWRKYFADVSVTELEGKVGLDAGCGKGRFARFTAPYLKALVALDGSDAVQAAVRNLDDLPNVLVVKGDLRSAPFGEEAFDFIYCLGVLHHLPDPQAGFEDLVQLLAPGGLMLIYLYSRPESVGLRSVALQGATLFRNVVSRIPLPALKWVSMPVAVLLYLTFVLAGRLGDRLNLGFLSRLPLKSYRGKPLRSLWLDTFDRTSAPIENRYLWDDLEVWFRKASTKVIAAREDAGWYVLVRKGNAYPARVPQSK